MLRASLLLKHLCVDSFAAATLTPVESKADFTSDHIMRKGLELDSFQTLSTAPFISSDSE